MKKYSNSLVEQFQKAKPNIGLLKISKENNLDFDIFKINQEISSLCDNNKNSLTDSSEIKNVIFM